MNSLTEINARQLLGLLANCFDMIDPRLIGHELRSASYADQLLEAAGIEGETRRDLDCLVFLHDIGAYKTEEINRMAQFAFPAPLLSVFHDGRRGHVSSQPL